MVLGEPHSREQFEGISAEVQPDVERIARAKDQLAERIKGFADRDPGIVESLRTAFDALVLRGRVEMVKQHREDLQREFIEGAHEEALSLEERHQELQENVVRAIDELQRFESDELMGGTSTEEKGAA